jgi:hypothetical protein
MTSSSGWLRSNILYDTLSETPPPGSPLEAVCASVYTRRQKAEFLKYKTLVQATVTSDNKDSTQKLLDSLHNEMFPDVEVRKADQSEIAKGIMERQLAKGPELVQTLE